MEYFEQTSTEPYDRHTYMLVYDGGKQSKTFEDYEQLRVFWFQSASNWNDCQVNVLDRKQNKKNSNGGFK